MTKGRILVAIVAPCLVIAGWLAYLAAAFSGGTDIVFKIEGYDPRDLLRGHYLQYRVLYDFRIPDRAVGMRPREECLCVTAGEDGYGRGTWIGDCAARDVSACPRFIRGRVDYQGFSAGIERFYFPEEYRGQLLTVPPGATALIRVARNGVAFVRDLKVGEESIVDYARRQGVEAASSPAERE